MTQEVPPVYPGIFSVSDGEKRSPRLMGGYCPECRRYFFPRPKYCPGCLGATEVADLGNEGSLYSYTVVRVKPPFGLPQPYALGYVGLEEKDLTVFCLLDPKAVDRLAIGQPVRLEVDQIGHDGTGSPRLRPYFSPIMEQRKVEA